MSAEPGAEENKGEETATAKVATILASGLHISRFMRTVPVGVNIPVNSIFSGGPEDQGFQMVRKNRPKHESSVTMVAIETADDTNRDGSMGGKAVKVVPSDEERGFLGAHVRSHKVPRS